MGGISVLIMKVVAFMENKSLIIRIENEEGATIFKGISPWGRQQFFTRIVYVCENGTKVHAHYQADRKKDVKAYVDKLPMEPKEMYALFNQDGGFTGTQQSISAMMGW
jgi:hypothetical protein